MDQVLPDPPKSKADTTAEVAFEPKRARSRGAFLLGVGIRAFILLLIAGLILIVAYEWNWWVAAPRRRAAQLPADGVVAGSRDGRGGPVTLGRAHPLLRHVDRVRGPHGELRPYGPRPARRDGHVRRRLAATL
jgi:hypothetical protein